MLSQGTSIIKSNSNLGCFIKLNGLPFYASKIFFPFNGNNMRGQSYKILQMKKGTIVSISSFFVSVLHSSFLKLS